MDANYYKDKSVAYGMSHTRRSRILKLVGNPENKKVLDIGCASGYMGSRLKEAGAYVVGVDISSKAIDIAKGRLNEAYLVEPGQILPPGNRDLFDIVLLTEVIEHIFDPVPILSEIREHINAGGFLIITPPNFMTWTNRLRFLFGNFRYADQGMFDFGHIRWFTYQYLKEIIQKSGFKIEIEEHIIFPGKLTKVLKFWPSFFASQFVVKARKAN